MLDLAAIPQSARFFDATKLLVHHLDALIARGYLALQLTKRALEILDAGADLFVLFDQLLIARKLAFSSSDTTLDLSRFFVDEIDGIAQSLCTVTIFFNF